MGMQAVQMPIPEPVTISKAIKKTVSNFKYGSFVYLVNGREKR